MSKLILPPGVVYNTQQDEKVEPYNPISYNTEGELNAKLKLEQDKYLKTREENLAQVFEEELKKNKEAIDEANSSPIPPITLLGMDLLIRATPSQIVNKSGIILKDFTNFNSRELNELDNHSVDVDKIQEVLILGKEVEKEYGDFLKVGMKIRLNEKNFVAGRAKRGKFENELYYEYPIYTVNSHNYMIINWRDILYIIN